MQHRLVKLQRTILWQRRGCRSWIQYGWHFSKPLGRGERKRGGRPCRPARARRKGARSATRWGRCPSAQTSVEASANGAQGGGAGSDADRQEVALFLQSLSQSPRRADCLGAGAGPKATTISTTNVNSGIATSRKARTTNATQPPTPLLVETPCGSGPSGRQSGKDGPDSFFLGTPGALSGSSPMSASSFCRWPSPPPWPLGTAGVEEEVEEECTCSDATNREARIDGADGVDARIGMAVGIEDLLRADGVAARIELAVALQAGRPWPESAQPRPRFTGHRLSEHW